MNQKGGTAKTVTAINTAAILARDYGHRVLLVDADSQANLTEFVQDQKKLALTAGGHSGLADLLKGFRVLPWETTMLGVKLLPATDALMDLDISKAGTGEADIMALAEFLGVNRSALARELGRMQDEGLISLEGRTVTLKKHNP